MRRVFLAFAILTCLSVYAFGGGQVSVMDPITKLPKYLKGGVGVDIGNDGTLAATGVAVPISIQPWSNISSASRGNTAPYSVVAAFKNYTAVDRATSAQLTAGLAQKSPLFNNYTTLVRFGAGPTYNGMPISAGGVAGVATFNARAGNVLPQANDYSIGQISGAATVASTGSYNDLSNKPSLALVATSGSYLDLSNKPSLSTVATTGAYSDLTGKPTLATVATSGSYTDLTNKPATYTLPTATTTVLGGVKVDGTSVVIDGAGVISSTVSAGVSSVDGSTGAVDLTGKYKTIAAFNSYSTATQAKLDLKANTASLGTAAYTASSAYATAAQGAKADSAYPKQTGMTFYSGTDTTHAQIEIDKATTPAGDRQGALHSVYARTGGTAGGAAHWMEYPVTASLNTGFDIDLVTLTRAENMNGGVLGAQWWVAATPSTNTGPWQVYGGEINVLNRYQDNGYQEDIQTDSHATHGLFIVPEANLNVGAGLQQGFNVSNGIVFAPSGAGGTYPPAKTHIPVNIVKDAIAPGGTGVVIGGGTTVPNAPGKAIKVTGYQTDGIDLSGATVSGNAIKLAPTQTISDGTVTKTLAQLASGGSMTYPAAGVPQSTGSAWGTSLGVVTTLGNPGVNTNVPTEKAVRDAIASAGGGTVTSITAGTGLTGGTITASGTLAVDAGVGANKIVQRDSNGAIPTAGVAATSLAGTVSTSPLKVTGVGTTFLSDFSTGDIITISGESRMVEFVANNSELYLDNSFSSVYTSVAYSKKPRMLTITDSSGATIGGISEAGLAMNVTTGIYPGVLYLSGQRAQIFNFTGTSGSANYSGYGLTGSTTAPAATTSGQTLVGFAGYGHDGNAFTASKSLMQLMAEETWQHGNSACTAAGVPTACCTGAGTGTCVAKNGTYMVFHTTASGGTSRTEKMRITGAGNVGIGTTSPGQKLDVAGATKSTSFLETVKANGTCSTSISIDPTLGGIQTLALSGACAIGVTNLAAGQSFTLKLTQSSTTAPTFTSAYKFPSATPPTWSTSATKYDVLSCFSDDGTTLSCNGMVDVR